MLRIAIKAQTAQEVVLAVQGRLVGASVQLFKQEVTRQWQESQGLVLDLNGVSFIDETGLALLQQWVGPSLSLRGGSPFLQALLAGEGLQVQ